MSNGKHSIVLVARLMVWPAPRALSRAAAEVSDFAAARIGIGAWFLAAALAAGTWAIRELFVFGYADCVRVMISTGFCCGLLVGITVGLSTLISMSSGEDGTTAQFRARRRVLLLTPCCAIVPLSAWATLVFLTHPAVSEALDLTLPIPPLLASGWTLLAILSAAAWVALAAVRSLRPPHESSTCAQCGYLLVGLVEARCPECGEAFDPVKLRRLADSVDPAQPLPSV